MWALPLPNANYAAKSQKRFVPFALHNPKRMPMARLVLDVPTHFPADVSLSADTVQIRHDGFGVAVLVISVDVSHAPVAQS